MNTLLERQNDIEFLKLLKASSVAYKKAKSWEIRITYFFILLAFAYPVTYVVFKDEEVRFYLLLCSFILTIAIQLFYNTFKGNTSRGAILKEEFDVELFGLPWKSTIKKTDHKEVSRLSKQYKGGKIEDWYSTSLSSLVPPNISVAVCQYSNTAWDIIIISEERMVDDIKN